MAELLDFIPGFPAPETSPDTTESEGPNPLKAAAQRAAAELEAREAEEARQMAEFERGAERRRAEYKMKTSHGRPNFA